MANLYTAQQLGISAPSGGFQTGGWYSGRQYWDGYFSDPGVINPKSNQQGAGQAVSQEVNKQSSVAQGKAPDAIQNYVQQQTQQQQQQNIQPAAKVAPSQPVPTNPTSSIPQSVGPTQTAVPNLTELYNTLYKDSGITNLQTQLKNLESDYLESRNVLTDNPFLSASSVDKRLQRISNQYEKTSAPLKNDVATKQADIETQLNLQLKQFDLNSQATQLAWQQFESLLASGALNGASGQDIANLTRMTGLSSGMIQSAISQSSKGNVNIVDYDDGQNKWFIAYDEKGNIVNRQLIGRSGTGSGKGYDTNSFLQELQEQSMRDSQLNLIIEEALNGSTYTDGGGVPQFSPATGLNTTYSDSTGSYIYTDRGWEKFA